MSEQEEKRKEALLHVHKVVDICGGKFRVQSLGKKFICLEACAGTDVVEHKVIRENAQLRLIAQENFVERQRLFGLVSGAVKKFGTEVSPGVTELELDYKAATGVDSSLNLEVEPKPEADTLRIKLVKKPGGE